VNKQEGNALYWYRPCTSPAINISPDGLSVFVNENYAGNALDHCAVTKLAFWRGFHTIHFLVVHCSWGLSVGIATATSGVHPRRHFLQMFADCTYGWWGDDLDIPPANVS
jgi:hypothetical protein